MTRVTSRILQKLLKFGRTSPFRAGQSNKMCFTEIFLSNKWNDAESVSGPGSTLAYTANLRLELPRLFQDLAIHSIFDAPCGDFVWMEHVLRDCGVNYLGGDIVDDLIASNRRKAESPIVSFQVFDVISDAFPRADLWLCRDCLFHFSFADIRTALANFVNSDIPYVLTTSHIVERDFENTDIMTGRFRRINLMRPPFDFPPPLRRIADWIEPHPPREMCLWNRESLIPVLNRRGF
jgi:hypothetical protein